MKKLICLMLVAVLAASLCIGCDKKTQGPDSDGPVADGEFCTLTIGVPLNPYILDYENNALTLWIEQKLNIDLKFEPYAGGTDIASQISTAVTAGERLPDILWGLMLSDANIQNYGRDENFQDLSVYYDDKEGVSKVFWDRLAENFSEAEQNEILLRLRDADNDGAIYSVPTMETSLIDIMDYQMWINTEWLDYLKLDMPHDIESLYNVLVAFKNGDPNKNGKKDEVALYGSQAGGLGADVINWLINLYIYHDQTKNFNVDDNGQVYAPWTTDAYRDALKFINKLIDEKLMLDSCFATNSQSMAATITPATGVPVVGIFAGHLTLHTTPGSEVLYQYEPLPMFGNVVFTDNTFRQNFHVTEWCQNPKRAFEVAMALWTEEGSYRNRYGEPGVHWTEPDEGATSAMGLDATIKIIQDPFMLQRDCNWGNAEASLVVNSEGETAQYADATEDPWLLYKAQLHAKSRELHDEGAEKYNPKNLMTNLYYTTLEAETATFMHDIANYYRSSRTEFCKGSPGFNPESDTDWNNYLKRLNELGLQDWLSLAQKVYNRQMEQINGNG